MHISPIHVTKTRISDGFWSPYQKLAMDVVIPYQEKILNDAIPGQEKSHALANMRIAAGLEEGEFYGMAFQDSDVAKWLEAAAYALAVRPDGDLDARVDAVIDLVAKAQEPSGYLDTYFMLKQKDGRWKDLLGGHELYCMGHMIEAAVGHYESTGKKNLLAVAEKMADHIAEVFSDRYGIPGHEEIEVGLMRLYEITGKQKYCDLAKVFIDARGQKPTCWKDEAANRNFRVFEMDPENLLYNQSFAPVREQQSAEGHAVRAVYLYRAMADLARATKDEALLAACKTLWENIENKKLYVTGAIGACGEWENFSIDYDLPGDRAYAETCAQIGLIFFAKAMLDIEPEGKYADMMERCLYNSTISGMALDGKHFFYVNPLEVNPGISGEIFGMRHVVADRPGWYACACCPPNLARMILSLGRLCWSESEDTIYSHLFIGQTANLKLADIELETLYPWKGYAKYTVAPKTDKVFALEIHIPGYVKKEQLDVRVNGEKVAAGIENGYIVIARAWQAGDTVEISFPMAIRRVYGTTRILDTIGKVCLMRGPIVYCLEGADNGEQIQALILPRDAKIEEKAGEGIFENTVVLEAQGLREADDDALYSEAPPERMPATITAIPYYLWDNRGVNQMRVWIRESV